MTNSDSSGSGTLRRAPSTYVEAFAKWNEAYAKRFSDQQLKELQAQIGRMDASRPITISCSLSEDVYSEYFSAMRWLKNQLASIGVRFEDKTNGSLYRSMTITPYNKTLYTLEPFLEPVYLNYETNTGRSARDIVRQETQAGRQVPFLESLIDAALNPENTAAGRIIMPGIRLNDYFVPSLERDTKDNTHLHLVAYVRPDYEKTTVNSAVVTFFAAAN